MSRIGRKPIAVPAGVKIQLAPDAIDVQGPKGKMNVKLPRGITLEQKGAELHAIRQNDDQAALHGVLHKLENLGVPLIAVCRVSSEEE